MATDPLPHLARSPAPVFDGRTMPFSAAVRVGDLLFLSGQLGNRPGTAELVPGGIAAETRQAMENMGAVLRSHGLTHGDLVKCNVILADIADWAAMNEVYLTFLAAVDLPARTTIGGVALAIGARIEIEAIAAVRRG